MAIFIVDDAGDNTDGLTWAKAYTSVFDAIGTGGAVAGDTICIGHNHIDGKTYSANWSPASIGAAHLVLQSVEQGVGSVAGGLTSFTPMTATSKRQIDTSNDGANIYTLALTGNYALLDCGISSGGNITVGASYYGPKLARTRLCPGPNNAVDLGDSTNSRFEVQDLIIDCHKDGTTERSGYVLQLYSVCVQGLVFENVAYRSGGILRTTLSNMEEISSADFSGFTHANVPELFDGYVGGGQVFVHHAKMPATFGWYTGMTWRGGSQTVVNVGTGNQPTQQIWRTRKGYLSSTTSVYRTNGAEVEGVAMSWGGPTTGIETDAFTREHNEFYTPWIPFVVETTGSKTFTVHIGNTQGDLTDAEIALQVEIKGAATSGLWSYLDDARDTQCVAAVAQADDTTSTWTGETMTYMQKLAVTATVNTVGLGRARVKIMKTGMTSTQDLYIDPKVIIT